VLGSLVLERRITPRIGHLADVAAEPRAHHRQGNWTPQDAEETR
jgi:hypothetical protein